MMEKLSRSKDIVATVATVLTMIFKVFIFGTVLFVYTLISLNWFGIITLILSGTVWVLGLKNIMLFYHVFTKQRRDLIWR